MSNLITSLAFSPAGASCFCSFCLFSSAGLRCQLASRPPRMPSPHSLTSTIVAMTAQSTVQQRSASVSASNHTIPLPSICRPFPPQASSCFFPASAGLRFCSSLVYFVVPSFYLPPYRRSSFSYISCSALRQMASGFSVLRRDLVYAPPSQPICSMRHAPLHTPSVASQPRTLSSGLLQFLTLCEAIRIGMQICLRVGAGYVDKQQSVRLH